MATSLQQCQDLLQDTKEENAKLSGKLQATEAQVDVLKQAREEVGIGLIGCHSKYLSWCGILCYYMPLIYQRKQIHVESNQDIKSLYMGN